MLPFAGVPRGDHHKWWIIRVHTVCGIIGHQRLISEGRGKFLPPRSVWTNSQLYAPKPDQNDGGVM